MRQRKVRAAGQPSNVTRLALATIVRAALGAALAGGLIQAHAQQQTLRGVFEAAWLRQPDAQALAARRDAAKAQSQAAQSWTPEPLAVELSTRTDRLNRQRGTREHELGVAIPLWLPGERSGSQAVADAEGRATESRATAAQLRLAATVRDAWWAWQRSRAELGTAQSQRDNIRRIAADVGKRLKAGDLARADQHQADGAVAAADAAVAQAEVTHIAALLQLRALSNAADATLTSDDRSASVIAEPEPSAGATTPTDTGALADTHAEWLALKDRAAVAEQSAALIATQSRANPELTVATTRDRSAFGEAYQQTFTVGVRIPLGAGPRQGARLATARADALELQAQAALERARLTTEGESARARVTSARTQLAAAERRAQLARESRGFFDKSFRLGESDLPTRLRIESEAAEAERQVERVRIELAASISAWRQALGLLPQ